LIERGKNWREDRVFYHDGVGGSHSMPATWTDLVAEDPFNVIALGRAAFRAHELLELVQLIEAIKP
jgi:hypothetical protein